MVHRRAEIEALLPLPTVTFHILIALAGGERHGYAILQEVAASTRGRVQLGAGTLYRSIARMLDQGLVAEAQDRPDPELDDERRRYYQITELGRAAARAETARLQQLVKLARASGMAPEKA